MRPERVRFGRRIFLALVGLGVFRAALPIGPAPARAAARSRGDDKKGETFSGNVSLCATCDMWDGPREVDVLKNQVVVPGGEDTEGRCLRSRYGYPGGENSYVAAGDICQWYRRSSELI